MVVIGPAVDAAAGSGTVTVRQPSFTLKPVPETLMAYTHTVCSPGEMENVASKPCWAAA